MHDPSEDSHMDDITNKTTTIIIFLLLKNLTVGLLFPSLISEKTFSISQYK